MKIAVIGSGLMGQGITLTSAIYGTNVINIDISADALGRTKKYIDNYCDKKIEKQGMSKADKSNITSRVIYSCDYDLVAEVDIVIEAIPESIQLKKDIFKKIDQIVSPHTILATNTSGLSISEIASVTQHPEKVIGVHFFSPVPVMKLIELIRGIGTSDDTYQTMQQFATKIDKQCVDAPEYPGFIVNRLLVPLINEAAFLVMEGCTPHDVDKAMKLGANHPMGPLQLADFIGVDIVLAIMNGLYNGFKDSKYRPCPILVNMVSAGHIGCKVKKGFYTY